MAIINAQKKIKGFNWVYIIGTIVVFGSVMAYGMVGVLVFGFTKESSLSMLGMIVPMSFVYYLTMRPVVNKLSKRIETLTDAMDRVANGELDYQINIKTAGEFTEAYSQFNSMALELKRQRRKCRILQMNLPTSLKHLSLQ